MSDTPPPPANLAEINLNYETPQRHGNAPLLLRLAGIFGLVSSGVDLLYGIGMIAMAIFMYYTLASAVAAGGGGGGAFVVAGGPGPAPVAPGAPGAPPAPAPSAAPAPAGPELPTPAAPAPAPAGAPGIGAGGVPAPGVPAPAPPAAPAPLPPGFNYLILGIYGGPGILSLLMVGPKAVGATKLLRLRKRAWGWGLAAGILGCTELWMFLVCCPLFIITLGAGIYTIVILCLPHVRVYIAAQQATHSAATISA